MVDRVAVWSADVDPRCSFVVAKSEPAEMMVSMVERLLAFSATMLVVVDAVGKSQDQDRRHAIDGRAMTAGDDVVVRQENLLANTVNASCDGTIEEKLVW